MKEKIDSLKTVKTSLLETKCSEEAKLTLDVAMKDFDNKINKYSQELLQYQKIESTWSTDYWDVNTSGLNVYGLYNSYNSNKLHKLCTLASVKVRGCVYQSKQNPKWQIANGIGPSQLQSPVSLAIQDSTRDIYVSDQDGMRIQVFSPEGEHKKLLDKFDNGPLQVISIDETYLSAYNSRDKALYKFSVYAIVKHQIKYSSSKSLKKVIPSNRQEYVSIKCHKKYEYTVNKLELMNQGVPLVPKSNLRELFPGQSPSMLQTSQQLSYVHSQPHASAPENITLGEAKSTSLEITPVDIAYYQDSIFLLSSQGGDLVYEFNTDCDFVRSFFPCPTMSRPLAMCVDREGNIIITGDHVKPVSPDSDSDSDQDVETKPINQSATTKLFVISQKGDLIIHEMDIPCENCIGIAVSSNFDIFLLNKDDSYVLSSL